MTACRGAAAPRANCHTECVAPAGLSGSRWIAGLRLVRLGLVVVFVVPPALLYAAIPGYRQQRRASAALRLVSRRALAALGVELRITGSVRTGPGLVVANHVSWLDVLVLAASADVVPVAKVEVAGWPLIGGIARRVGTVFVSRGRLRELPAVVDRMAVLMRRGHRVQVFPESTTRCGRAVGEFHRAPFQAALDAAVVVMPASIAYRTETGDPSVVAFVGDDDLISALRRTLGLPGIVAELHWLPAIPAVAGTGHAAVDRQAVARLCQRSVARSLGQPVVGRRRERAAHRIGPRATGHAA